MIFALMILAILIIQDPHAIGNRRDIELMKRIERFLAEGLTTDSDSALARLIHYCSQYREIAEQEVDKAILMGETGNYSRELTGP